MFLFYWWNRDRLDKEQLKEQLDILSSSATDGFAVSYIHIRKWIPCSIKTGMAYMDGLSLMNLLYFQMSGGISGNGFQEMRSTWIRDWTR